MSLIPICPGVTFKTSPHISISCFSISFSGGTYSLDDSLFTSTESGGAGDAVAADLGCSFAVTALT
ncbi:MAG: hypothetical protein WA672_17615, partial [Candidatus Angelobacter sp.]